MKNQLNDPNLKNKFNSLDKIFIKSTYEETLKWIENNL